MDFEKIILVGTPLRVLCNEHSSGVHGTFLLVLKVKQNFP